MVLVLALLGLVLVGLLSSRVLRNVRPRGEGLPDRLARLAPAAWARARFPRPSAWLARRIDPDARRGFVLSFAVVAGAACAWIFVGLMQDVVADEEVALSDPGVTRSLVAHRVAWATAAMKGVTWLGSNAVLVPLVVALVVYLMLRRQRWRVELLLIGALVGANAWYHVLKPLVGRARPPEALHVVGVSGFAFPSGHATAAIAVWGAVALVISTRRSWRLKTIASTAAGVIAALVAFSRVYLGVHWWTDVVAGLALGATWLCVLGSAFLLWPPEVVRPAGVTDDLRGPAADSQTSDRAGSPAPPDAVEETMRPSSTATR
jgi:membrane-associated phospholipid phosphatase